MRFLPAVLGLLVLSFAAAGLVDIRSAGVEAGTAIRMDITELAQSADLIVEGRILSSLAFENDGRIETEYLLEVERTFAGVDHAHRAVRVPGGVLEDGRGMLLAGMPRIQAGEDVLLFLGREGTGGLRMPVGLAQGKFTIVSDGSGGRKRLVRDAAGVTLLQRDGELAQGEGRIVMDYADVVARIRAARAGGRDR